VPCHAVWVNDNKTFGREVIKGVIREPPSNVSGLGRSVKKEEHTPHMAFGLNGDVLPLHTVDADAVARRLDVYHVRAFWPFLLPVMKHFPKS
jgi:hypothetical protein